jgi:hypothetical protein
MEVSSARDKEVEWKNMRKQKRRRMTVLKVRLETLH